MSLKQRITDDMKAAMKARETARLSAIRMLIAALRQREIDERIDLDDTAVAGVVEKTIKQRRDAAEQYEAAGRSELAQAERFEIEVLSVYLPKQLEDAEIAAEISRAIADSGASGPADIGKVMGPLKTALAGRADMSKVSALVRQMLAGH